MYRNAATALICCATLFAIPTVWAAELQTHDSSPTLPVQTGATKSTPQNQVGIIDFVVAVVNEDVITRNQLTSQLSTVVRQLQSQDTPLPEADVLEKQVLERMINDLLVIQFARENGVKVDDSQLDQALLRIAQQNNFPALAEFRTKLESDGINYKKFREEIRNEIISNRVREREIENKLVISDSEVDQYVANKANMGGVEEEYHLAHILVVIPEQASAEKINQAKEKAEQALSKLNAGADFAQVAAGYSDAKDALSGGDLGWRPVGRLPPLFATELQKIEPGKNTPVLRSPSGFHILKLWDKRSTDKMLVTQTHARHILIKTSEIVSESEARNRVMEIMKRIEGGADFAEQARRYSQDGSAQKGGDLDWLSPGQTVMEFEVAMNKLQPGMIGLAQSQFGWHLIQVLERKNTDISAQMQRQQARQAIGMFKSDEQFLDWQRQLRDRAFIEYRIEENH